MSSTDPQRALSPEELTLVETAHRARTGAVCPFSGFQVGAAFIDHGGRCFTGANVENASYNLGLCAERVALYYAITHGAGRLVMLAIATDAARPTYPCGACRQALSEFAPHATVLLANRDRHIRCTVAELLPHAFDASDITDPSPPR